MNKNDFCIDLIIYHTMHYLTFSGIFQDLEKLVIFTSPETEEPMSPGDLHLSDITQRARQWRQWIKWTEIGLMDVIFV